MKTTPVFLDTKPVSYVIGDGALTYSQRLFDGYDRIFMLLDENVQEHCLPVFRQHFPDIDIEGIICIQSGEERKNLEQTVKIWDEMTAMNVDRDSLLINLGGGVVTDIGGFAASTFKRGISFINFPTTLLGMVDAAIGGKTGIDYAKLKNQVGLFTDPISVVIDPIFLKTLDDIQWQSGFAEVLKYGLIIDHSLWDFLYPHHFKEIEDWDQVISLASRDKIDIVRHDFMERGVRKNLNFGHTIGHAFESYFLKSGKAVTHGQSIAAGMICEAWLSSRVYGFEEGELEEIVSMFDINFERLDIKEDLIPELFELMRHDKKVRGGQLNFSLLRKIGKAIHNIEVDNDLVAESIRFYIHGHH
ncbi:MAG: 3-dehydroquinate synthase [bacterium]|jgi:3-dehydroquinate synthase